MGRRGREESVAEDMVLLHPLRCVQVEIKVWGQGLASLTL